MRGGLVRGLTRAAWTAALVASASGSAAAQTRGTPSASASVPAPGTQRSQLEQQVRERFGRVVQQRLGLTDAQMTRLQQTNRRFEGERRQLLQQERQVRLALRSELGDDSAANQAHVDALIRRAIQIQRQRLDLVEREQGELAAFLSPVQRARYLDLQEKLRRRVEQLRTDREMGDSGARRAPPRRAGPRR
jgi:Spy/CpxP family protein refolding chaperone